METQELLNLVWEEMVLHTPIKIEQTNGTEFDKGYIFYQDMAIEGFKRIEEKLNKSKWLCGKCDQIESGAENQLPEHSRHCELRDNICK